MTYTISHDAEPYTFTRLPKLRAIWAILRNGSVVWNANLRQSEGILETRAGHDAYGIVVLHNLLVDGRPLELNDMHPQRSPHIDANHNVGADSDQEIDNG